MRLATWIVVSVVLVSSGSASNEPEHSADAYENQHTGQDESYKYELGEQERTQNLYRSISNNYSYSKEVNFSEVWGSQTEWGGVHGMYSLQLETEALVNQGDMREDCRDIRVSSGERLVGSRVESGTCNTNDTWIYFSNVRDSGGLVMDPQDKIGNVTVHYGNDKPGVRRRHASEYSIPAVSLLKPESAVEMYYGSHDDARVAHSAHLHQNDKDAPKHTWHAEFDNYGNDCCNTFDDEADSAVVEDEQGNTETFNNINSNGIFELTSSNIPGFVQRGEDITVQFDYAAEGGGGTARTTGNAQWGRELQFSNPSPPDSSTIQTENADLSVDVQSESGGVSVEFYDASDDTQIGSTQTGIADGGTASVTWSGLADGQHQWYAEANDGSTTKQSQNYQFTVDADPEIVDQDPAGGSTVDTDSPELSLTVSDPNDNAVDVDFFEQGENTLIGEAVAQTGSGSGTATTTWGNLDNGSHTWYAEVNDGTTTVESSDYQFNVNTPPDIASLLFQNKTGGHRFQLGALVEENEETLSCGAAAEADGEKKIYPDFNPSSKNDSYSWCNKTIEYDDELDWEDEHDNDGKLLTANVTVNTTDTSSGKQDSLYRNNTFPNHQPIVVQNSFNYSEIRPIYGFNTTVNVSDPDNGGSEIRGCTLKFSDNDGNSIKVGGEIRDRTAPNTKCHYNNTNSTQPSGFEVNEEIEVSATTTDIHGNKSNARTSINKIPNTEPELDISEVQPADQTRVSESPVTIEVEGEDPEGEGVATYIINATGSGNNLLSKTKVPGAGNSYSGSYDWSGVRIGEPTYWSVNLSDKYTNYSSPVFSFEKVTSSLFRVQIDIPRRYRTISTTRGARKSITFTVSNPSAREKNMEVSLHKINSTIERSGSSKLTTTISAGDAETFRATLEPQNTEDRELIINASNRDTLLDNKKRVAVDVKSPVVTDDTDARQVPGITVVNLFVVAAAGLALFWFS